MTYVKNLAMGKNFASVVVCALSDWISDVQKTEPQKTLMM